MPLDKSTSEEAKEKNIHEMLYSGYPVKRAVAAALRTQDEAKKDKS